MNNPSHLPPRESALYKKYKIISLIGTGGMGAVYLVETLDSEKKRFALKYRHTDRNVKNLERFKSELNFLKKIKSKNIPYVYDYHINEGIDEYFVMEYIEGLTIKESIKLHGSLNTRTAITYAKQIAAGLSELHNLGIIHRDIKSENIIISKTQDIKIIDLGISLDSDSQRYTKTNNVLCSPYYAAPETLNGKEHTTKLVDVYALGILLYEMLTGKYPYSGSDSAGTIIMHKNNEMPRVKDIVEVSQAVENIIIKATAKDPTKRYQDMWELRQDLDTCLSVSKSMDEPLSTKTIKPKKKITDFINSIWFTITAILLAILILIISIILIVVFIG
ncbi:serine/threonine-protein kinase [Mycoplasmopsis alligatoris]|uniref:Kinase domain protein n=1 Tax=Mycoplasmopsis alligatoris A21JP2 TaxID=747682 RepID=D4XX30_9BACT|nr:serine/threonine-protein kinase [Mycoplasmopsis alligatoris]EFF41094.1 kinase domain protein [Mycoplasmopsis alligatoris A21JP2]